MADRPLPGYDTSFGNKKAMVIDHHGPASYVTGGERFSAKQLGWGGLEMVLPVSAGLVVVGPFVVASVPLTFSQTYFVQILYDTTTVGATASVTIIWYAAATGLQVVAGTDLSAEAIRLFALGV